MLQYNGDAISEEKSYRNGHEKTGRCIICAGADGCVFVEPSKPAETEKPKAPRTADWQGRLSKDIRSGPRMGPRRAALSNRSRNSPETPKGARANRSPGAAGFASPRNSTPSRPYTWANGDVSFGVEDTYSPSNTSTTVFDQAFLKVDSNQALETAQKHGETKCWKRLPTLPSFIFSTGITEPTNSPGM